MSSEKEEKIEKIMELVNAMNEHQLDALLFRLQQKKVTYQLTEHEVLLLNEDYANYQKGKGTGVISSDESIRQLREKLYGTERK